MGSPRAWSIAGGRWRPASRCRSSPSSPPGSQCAAPTWALAFGAGSTADDRVKAAVLLGSVISAGLAATVLSRRNTTYRRVAERERLDADGDGVPDVYQHPDAR